MANISHYDVIIIGSGAQPRHACSQARASEK